MSLQNFNASGMDRPENGAPGLSRGDLLARQHECLARADLFAIDHPELSDSWHLLAGQWQLLLDLPRPDNGWDRPRAQPLGLTLLLQ